MKHAISWFEIPVNDLERAIRFYSEILEVEFEHFGFNGQELAIIPGDEESINGALIKGEGYVPSKEGSIVYLNAGEDLNNVLLRVEAAGGMILEGKTEVIEGRVFAAVLQDTEGNRVGIYSNK
jgi:predicted enzyme related to lactoylglutathione lyase